MRSKCIYLEKPIKLEELIRLPSPPRINVSVCCILGSLWGISHCQWLASSNDANLALVVPGRLLCLWLHRLATPQKRTSCYYSNSSVEEGLNSNCLRPTGTTYALEPSHLAKKERMKWHGFWWLKNYDLTRLYLNTFQCVCVPTRRVPIYLNLVYFGGNTELGLM
jgi:hypothetical protein